MATQHTPGPWRVSEEFLGSHNVITDAAGRWIGETYHGDPIAQKANASLIAAAPDLLAALKAVRETCPADSDINPRWQAAWNAMEAAIKKAEAS